MNIENYFKNNQGEIDVKTIINKYTCSLDEFKEDLDIYFNLETFQNELKFNIYDSKEDLVSIRLKAEGYEQPIMLYFDNEEICEVHDEIDAFEKIDNLFKERI